MEGIALRVTASGTTGNGFISVYAAGKSRSLIMAITSTPQTTGSFLAVSTSAKLAQLSTDGLCIGTQVYNEETGSYFALLASSAALSSSVVAVAGTSGVRWIQLNLTSGTPGAGQFGTDTILQQANSSGVQKNTFEFINTYVNSASGSEESQVTISGLRAGGVAPLQTIGAFGSLFPSGVFDGTPSHTKYSVASVDVGTGFRKFVSSTNKLAFGVDGSEIFYLSNGLSSSTTMELSGTVPNIVIGGSCSIGRVLSSGTADVQIASLQDVVLGADGARDGSTSGGWNQLASYAAAGKPSGTPNPHPGHFIISYNTTTKKIEVYDPVNHTWLETAALS